ncbi:MAG: RidA family protein [Myxococcales bacterium]|nr:RidA family protein [Myxococcales bacterium]MCB9714997.1 RidA family protein [Myxococcales bacterium]
MDRRRVSSGAPWEDQVGYCRAVRAGDHVYVTGTIALEPDGSSHAPGDGYAQAKRCLEIIESALLELGAGLPQVVRTRMFVTDISRWAEYGRAHAEAFGPHRPASTMVEVRRLIRDECLIEIEADAVVDRP